MVKWKVAFSEKENKVKNRMKKIFPLSIMKLVEKDLDKQFTVTANSNNGEYTSRELVFKFYESNSCKIFHLTGNNSVTDIIDLITEIPPVYIFHSELSLTNEEFIDLSKLNILNAIYAIKIGEHIRLGSYPELFLYNLEKVIEEGLQYYWLD